MCKSPKFLVNVEVCTSNGGNLGLIAIGHLLSCSASRPGSIVGEARDIMKNFAEMCKLLTDKRADGTDRIHKDPPSIYDVRTSQVGGVSEEEA